MPLHRRDRVERGPITVALSRAVGLLALIVNVLVAVVVDVALPARRPIHTGLASSGEAR